MILLAHNVKPAITRHFSVGPGFVLNVIPLFQTLLIQFYGRRAPNVTVARTSLAPEMNGAGPVYYLEDKAEFHKYIVLKGKRIVASTDTFSAPNALVQVHIDAHAFVGQVHSIFTHRQQGIEGQRTFLYVKWFQPLRPGIIDGDMWSA